MLQRRCRFPDSQGSLGPEEGRSAVGSSSSRNAPGCLASQASWQGGTPPAPDLGPRLLSEDQRVALGRSRACAGSCRRSAPWPIMTADAPCTPTRSARRSSATSPCSAPATPIKPSTFTANGCTPDRRLLIWLQQTANPSCQHPVRFAPESSSHGSPYTGWPPPSRSTLDPNSSEDSSAPRRPLDGGVSPAADGRSGGQARPRRWRPRSPCR
jgi:hypothetical protein